MNSRRHHQTRRPEDGGAVVRRREEKLGHRKNGEAPPWCWSAGLFTGMTGHLAGAEGGAGHWAQLCRLQGLIQGSSQLGPLTRPLTALAGPGQSWVMNSSPPPPPRGWAVRSKEQKRLTRTGQTLAMDPPLCVAEGWGTSIYLDKGLFCHACSSQNGLGLDVPRH